jgi:GNAT superfamily N-acetyltransferase
VSSTLARAESADTDWIAELIGAAFCHLGPTRWLVPDPAQRAGILPRTFAIYVEHAMAHGEVHVTTDRSAAAVWVPRGWAPLPPPADYDRRLADVCGEWTDRFRQLDELFEKHTPTTAHHHLAFLAVRRDRQGAGIGSSLLSHHHARLDREGLPAFLEASSPRARSLYLRHGYRDLGEPYAVGNGSLFWPMWREPAPGPASSGLRSGASGASANGQA